MVKGDGKVRDVYAELYGEHDRPYPPPQKATAAPKSAAAAGFVSNTSEYSHQAETSIADEGPGLLSRIQDTQAYGRIKDEASTIGDQFLSEVTKTTKEIVVPAAIGWLRHWLEGVIPQKGTTAQSQSQTTFGGANPNQQPNQPANRPPGFQPTTERSQ
jgi:hypothetical protein